MTEKDMLQMNDQDLEQVAGGRAFDYKAQQEFLMLDTAEEAQAFLASCQIKPANPGFHVWMKKWQDRHRS